MDITVQVCWECPPPACRQTSRCPSAENGPVIVVEPGDVWLVHDGVPPKPSV